MARYNIYYLKYNIIANDYTPYIKVVDTDDIYHEVGKMICKSLEKIDHIRYTQPKASKEDCEKLWIERGYRKITDVFWVKDCHDGDAVTKSELERLKAELKAAKTAESSLKAQCDKAKGEIKQLKAENRRLRIDLQNGSSDECGPFCQVEG